MKQTWSTIIVFVAQKRSCLCEAQAHNLHITTQCSTNTETAPYHRDQGHKLLKTHKRTSWEHDYVGLAQAHPNKYIDRAAIVRTNES